MAIIFELWAECRDDEGARRLVEHFDGLSHTLLTGKTITWSAGVDQVWGIPSAVSIYSLDLSRRGVCSLTDALEATEGGLRLLHHLMAAPDFRYARLDWEAGCIPMAELPEWVTTRADGRDRDLNIQCVIDETLWVALGQPLDMPPFRPGYRWKRYQGEVYRPLGSVDHPELRHLRETLLPP
jgi:hypothetical protein